MNYSVSIKFERYGNIECMIIPFWKKKDDLHSSASSLFAHAKLKLSHHYGDVEILEAKVDSDNTGIFGKGLVLFER